MPTVPLNNTELFYTDDGAGRPLLFIHGLGATHHMFEPQVERFSATHRVICPDTRGNGHPDRLAGLVVVDSFGDTRIAGLTEALLLLSQWAALWAYYLPPSWLIPAVRAQYKRWPLARAHLVRILAGMRRHEVVLQRLAINRADHTQHLDRVRCPALGIVGDATSVGVRYMERAMKPIPGARLEVVHDSFDPTNLCQRESFDRLLTQFLSEIGW